MLLRSFFLSTIFIITGTVICQTTINGYASVSAIATNTLTLTNVDEANGTFEDGDYIIIMQIQDDVIGTNTANNSSFGDLNSIQSAGLFEVRQILSHTEASGLPTTITISTSTTNTYNINANASIQIITFPTLGAPNYTTTANLTAKAWDGQNGGVLAFNVDGTLTLSHDISVDFLGFRGGLKSANYYSGGTGCSTTEYIRTSNHTRSGQKGEGIYRTSTSNLLYARGKLINGGGGGSERINCGGGGGSNFSAGGEGGFGWSCPSGPGGGGIGGLDLSSVIAGNRIFFGGGGGGGQQNNSASTDGGNGGGIVIIRANTITASCGSNVSITANGQQPANSGNDGGGGAGAGGSILFEVNSWSIPGTCPITISSNGGTGSNNTTGGHHAGGGGGGQGAVLFNIAEPTTNTTIETENGAGGTNCGTCTSASGGAGTDDAGIISSTTTPLPIQLIMFDGYIKENNETVLFWETASEQNCSHFNVQKSENGLDYYNIGTIEGNATTSKTHFYDLTDRNSNTERITYYRLMQYDFNGQAAKYGPISIHQIKAKRNGLMVYPNPAKDLLFIECEPGNSKRINIYNAQQKIVESIPVNDYQTLYTINIEDLNSGLYMVEFGANKQKLIIK
ncbi:MAG: T9SS type A sorting domain-containing protein [Crocinitomicaceae bacterium]